MNIKRSAVILASLSAVALVGAGCLFSPADSTPLSETAYVRDALTGMSFSYPKSLGEVRTEDETGWLPSDQSRVPRCLVQRSFLAGDTIFLTSYDTWQCDQLGRGGYWGDQARTFSTENDVKKWCETKDRCEPFVNPNGITIYRAWTRSVDVYGTVLYDIDEYGAWNPTKDIHGVLISNQGFVQNGQDGMKDELLSVANSLSFGE